VQNGTTIAGYGALQNLTQNDFSNPPANAPPRPTAVTATQTAVSQLDVAWELSADPTRAPDEFWTFRVTIAEWKSVAYETVFLKSASYWHNKDVSDPLLLQHERGHVDVREIYTREANARVVKILERLNTTHTFLVQVPAVPGQTATEARQEALGKVPGLLANLATEARVKETAAQIAKYERTQNDYDVQVKDEAGGVVEEKQIAYKQKLREQLTPGPGSPGLESSSDHTVGYHAATQTLTLTDDVISGVGGGTGPDPVVGAVVDAPVFHLEGETSWHDLLFAALGDQTVAVSDGTTTFLTGTLPYLIYSGGQFTGVLSAITIEDGGSPFLAALQADYASGAPFLLGIRVTPDGDLAALTQGFTADGALAFTNLVGPVPSTSLGIVPEPSAALLLIPGVLALLARPRRRSDPGAPRCSASLGRAAGRARPRRGGTNDRARAVDAR
jgi:hypothetical protein